MRLGLRARKVLPTNRDSTVSTDTTASGRHTVITPPFCIRMKTRVYLANKVLDPHTTKLDAGADPRDEAAYAKFSQKEYANDLIFDELISFVGRTERNRFS